MFQFLTVIVGVNLPCHSYYNIIASILSILSRAPIGATRHNHHLALLIVLAKFLIVVAGDRAKTHAPNLVSIMFADEETDADCLNIIMGPTIPRHPTLKDKSRQMRYTFLVQEGFFTLRGLSNCWDRWLCGQFAETFALVLLKRWATLSLRVVSLLNGRWR